jgi:Uma2 family endonuclease
MALVQFRDSVSVADYLAGEEAAAEKHEYLAGEVHAMSGASARHNLICLNLAAALHRHLAGGPCRVFMADLKVRLSVNDEDYFYYPDIMVACNPADQASHFRTQPSVLVEVMSPSTERIDRREKLFAYRTLDSLREYVLIEQDAPVAVAYVRTEDRWSTQRPEPSGMLTLPSLNFSIPVAELYRGTEGL